MEPHHRTASPGLSLQGIALAVCWVLAGAAAALAAPGEEDAATMRTTARDFLQELHAEHAGNLTVQVGHLDSRLRLARCDEGKEAFLPNGSRTMGHVTVGIRCPGPRPWTVYVAARVEITGTVLVAKRAMRRGELLSERELRSAEMDLGGLSRGYVTDPAEVVGKRLKRSAREGQVIAPSMLEATPLVRRGEQVGIIYASKNFFVRAEGIALADGGAGESIKVRNRSSEKVLDGVVIAASLVRVSR